MPRRVTVTNRSSLPRPTMMTGASAIECRLYNFIHWTNAQSELNLKPAREMSRGVLMHCLGKLSCHHYGCDQGAALGKKGRL